MKLPVSFVVAVFQITLSVIVSAQDTIPRLEIPDIVAPKVYTNVRVLSVTGGKAKISHDTGLAVIPSGGLPKEVLAKFPPSDGPAPAPTSAVPSPTAPTASSATSSPPSQSSSSFDPNGLVFIKTDTAAGSGFIASVGGKTYVYTNAHVICGEPGGFTSKLVSIRTASGREIPLPYKIELSDTYDPASPRGLEDVARFPVDLKDGETAYQLASLDVSGALDQDVVAYGNSLGSDVITSLEGKIVAVGVDRIEISCQIVPGNSGGPVVLPASRKVIGISTYATNGNRDIWTKNTQFEGIRRFAVRPEKITKWRNMPLTGLISAIGEFKAFDRDTLSLAAACFLDPKANRGGFVAPSVKRGDYVIRDVLVDGSTQPLGAAISNGIARVNQRLGGAPATLAMQTVVPVFTEFFSSVAAASTSQIESLKNPSRAPYLKQFVPEMVELRSKIHAEFVKQGATRFR